jgi:hypothetical protein
VQALDVSGIAARRRAVWHGGAALAIVGLAAGAATAWAAYGAIGIAGVGVGSGIAAVLVGLSRALRRGRGGAGVAALVLAGVVAAAIAAVLMLVDTFDYQSMLAAAGAWCAYALARAGVAVRDSALRYFAAFGAVVLIVASVGALTRAGWTLIGIQSWALVCLPLTAYFGVRMVFAAVLRAPRSRDEPAWFAGWERVTGSVARGAFNRALLAWGLFILVPFATIPWSFGLLVGVLALPFVVAGTAFVWLAGSKWLRLGREWSGLDGPFSRVWDARGSVLYLRSFGADRTRIRATPVRYLLDRRGRTYVEEAIARGLRPYGRVVAAAEPGDRADSAQPADRAGLKAPLGAKRKRLDENWQTSLLQWMRESQLIVSTAGHTEGFLWELRQIKDLALADKLVFVVPPSTTADDWATVARLFGKPLPQRIDASVVRAVVPGGGDVPQLIISRGARDFDYELAVELAAHVVLARRAHDGTVEPAPAVAQAIRRRARTARKVGIAAIFASVLPIAGLVLGLVAMSLAADASTEIARGGIDAGRDAARGRRLGVIAVIASTVLYAAPLSLWLL